MHEPGPLDRIASEDVTAFVERHQTGLWRYLRLCGAGTHAEDVAQEALLVAIRKNLLHLDDKVSAAFLRRTGKNIWLRLQRDDRRRGTREAEAAEVLWQQHLATDDGSTWLDTLKRCVQELPPRSRRALDLTYRDGLARRDLAGDLGISEHGARTLLQRVRATLKSCIERKRPQ